MDTRDVLANQIKQSSDKEGNPRVNKRTSTFLESDKYQSENKAG